MGDTEKRNNDFLRNHQTLLSNTNDGVSQLNLSQSQDPMIMNQNLQNLFSSENVRRMAGIPPSHTPKLPIYLPSQITMKRPISQQMNLQSIGFHSRSLSIPHVFNYNSIPPITSSSQNDALASENCDGGSNPSLSLVPTSSIVNKDGLPSQKLHRRSISDAPFGINNGIFQSPPLPPLNPHSSRGGGLLRSSTSGSSKLVMKEPDMKLDGETMDDLLKSYMELEDIDLLNYGGVTEKNDNDNSKTKGSANNDNDIGSSANESGCSRNMKDILKRGVGSDIGPTVRHQRSISMDSFMGNFQLNDDSPNLPPSAPQQSNPLSISMFSGLELEKIMANEKLAEIVVYDPKRVKRILGNRQSAARSKERKMRYIAELEHKVHTIQTEATTLSTQLTMLQNEFQGLNSLNNELNIRLLSMEQQAKLRNDLHDALTKEIHHLRIVNRELNDQLRGLNNFQMLQK